MNPTRVLCYVRDNRSPVLNRRSSESKAVSSADELTSLLREFSRLEPRVLIVSVPAGPTLFVGIGGDLAGVSVYLNPNPPPGQYEEWTALANSQLANTDMDFISEGESQEFAAHALMSVEEAILIVGHIVRNSTLPKTHTWVNPHGDVYGP